MSRAVPRRVLFALLLLPVAGLLVLWSEFRTQFALESTETGVRLTVNGQVMEAPAKVGPLRSFAVTPEPSFFTLGAGTVTITGPNGQSNEYPQPSSFRFTPPAVPFAADWWIDYAKGTKLAMIRQRASAPEPWRLSLTFHGRGRARVLVEGDREIVGGFRAGDIDNDLILVTPDGAPIASSALRASWSLEARHLLYWPAAGLFMACCLIVAFAAAARMGRHWRWEPRRAINWSPVIFALLLLNLVIGLWTAYSVLDARPHFQDDLGYLLRAKWLVAGHISLPKPEHSEYFNIPFTMFRNDRWISYYPVGWPLLLALGQSVNAAWLAAPVCALIAAFASWRIGKAAGGSVVGVMAVALLTLSPLNAMLSGSMLSHAATAMWLALFAWLFLRAWGRKRGWRSLALAGIALGLAFSTRPLSGFAVGVVAGIFLLFELKHRHFSADTWRGIAAFAAGGVAGSLPALIDNWMTTGSPFTFAYNLAYSQIWTPRAYEGGLFWLDRMVALMPALAFGWGWPWLADWWPLLALTFAFAMIPFVLGRASRADWLLLGIFCLLPLCYIGFSAGTGLHGFGPRYFVDIFFALALLTARGFQELGRVHDPIAHSPAPRYVAVALFVVLAASSAVTLRQRISLYTGYNDVDARLEKALAQQNVTKGLVLLGEPIYLNWIRAGRLLPVGVRSNLVFAARQPDNAELVRAYAGWPVFEFDNGGLRAHEKDAP